MGQHDGASRALKQARRCAFFLLGALLVPSTSNAAAFPAATGERFAVATDSADATRAAVDALEHGGNAADAAVAAALALGVVAPAGSGLGGGGFALVYLKKTEKVVAIDFREYAPREVDTAYLMTRAEPAAKDGRAVGLPGEPFGLEALTRSYGKRSLRSNAEYAIRLARSGFVVSSHTRKAYADIGARLEVGGELQHALASGSKVIQRADLAKTLETYGDGGARALFAGDTGARIESSLWSHHASLKREELTNYVVRQSQPMQWDALGLRWATMPMPSAGGLMLRQVSMSAEAWSDKLLNAGMGSSGYIHALSELFRGALLDRAMFASDPSARPLPASVFDAEKLRVRRDAYDENRTTPLRAPTPREGGTTHLVVVDAEGNAVTLTTTVNSPFGSGIEVPGTGLLMNDELYDFSTRAEEEALGIKSPGPNAPAPGMRPVSSMTPAFAWKDGQLKLAIGGSGGPRIATGVAQTALCIVLLRRDAGDCVAASRTHLGWDNTVFVDEDAPGDVKEGLLRRGESVRATPNGSAVQAVVIDNKTGKIRLKAASDPRKRGLAVAR